MRNAGKEDNANSFTCKRSSQCVVIRKAGFDTLIGKENFSPNIDAAIEKAEKITSNR